MGIELRNEAPYDHRAVEQLTRDAFWDVYQPGCDEHYLVHLLRKSDAFIPQLSIVAEEGDRIIGHVILTRAHIEDGEKARHEALCLGPISVCPNRQKQGVGTLMMKKAIARARELDYCGILLFGHPGYYGRFGYANAKVFGISTATGQNFDEFMALPLYPGGFDGICGRFICDKAFDVIKEDALRFDEHFEARQRHVTDTQIFK